MVVSVYKIKKWSKMLLGKSVDHVNQGEGLCYSKDEIKGYYNDFTEKITRFGYNDSRIPLATVDGGKEIYFPISIFQYGLGAYDLFLLDKNESSFDKFISCADWAVNNQQHNGGWITFAYKKIKNPYSSMAQAEAVSLLIRAYIETEKSDYLDAARKAIDYMLLPVEQGGTAWYSGEDVGFLECSDFPLILNGWIFSLWGLYDYYKFTNCDRIHGILNKSLDTLKRKLPEFDIKYWSKYDIDRNISSPFYHRLHINQLITMHKLFGDDIYKKYADKWEGYTHSWFYRNKAFVKKAIQKLF